MKRYGKSFQALKLCHVHVETPINETFLGLKHCVITEQIHNSIMEGTFIAHKYMQTHPQSLFNAEFNYFSIKESFQQPKWHTHKCTLICHTPHIQSMYTHCLLADTWKPFPKESDQKRRHRSAGKTPG